MSERGASVRLIAEQRHLSYGKFRQSQVFARLFPDFAERQKAAAEALVTQVLRHCDGHGKLPEIRTIIDIGCGDGGLLMEIVQAMDREAPNGTSPIRFIGIDSCPEFQPHPQANDYGPRVTFHTGRVPDFLESGGWASGIEWGSTAVLCLSHTWFHFDDMARVQDFINTNRPALLLIDVFKTWDRVLEKLVDGQPYDEAHRWLDSSVYFLRTIKNGDRVERGIACKPQNDCVERDIVHEPPTDWVFKTNQAYAATAVIRPSQGTLTVRPKDIPVCANAATLLRAGQGCDKSSLVAACDYLVLDEIAHDSGWGAMNCIVLGALSREARAYNEAYFAAVKSLVDELLFAGTTEGEEREKAAPSGFQPARAETSCEDVRALLRMFGRGEVAVIMPFDPLRAFARMIPLRAYQRPDLPSHESDQAPPRGGCNKTDCENCELLYRVTGKRGPSLAEILAHIDLAIEQPNKWQRRYATAYSLHRTLLDLVSSPIGFPLFELRDYEASEVDWAFDALEFEFIGKSSRLTRGEGASFFLIPFFYGSLPLFVLILEEPPALPTLATHAHVYSALAQNLDRQLHLLILDDKIQTSVIAPFVRNLTPAAIESPDAQQSESTGGRGWRTRIKKAWEHAMEGEQRPWKSWVVTLPSQALSSMIGTRETFNKKIREALEQELERAGADGAFKISKMLEAVAFFTGNNHEEWQHSHAEMLAGLRGKLPWAEPGTAGSVMQTYLALDEEQVPYLWFFAEAVSHAREGEEGQVWFDALKRVFCRAAGNNGPWFRFSISRLYAVAAIAAGQFEAHKFRDFFERESDDPVLGRFHASNDPTAAVYDWVRTMQRVNFHTFSADFDSDLRVFTLEARLWERLSAGRGGETLRKLIRLSDKLSVLPDGSKEDLAGSNLFRLRVRVPLSRKDTGIELELGGGEHDALVS